MKKIIYYLFFMIFISFFCVITSNAECSYQDRKNLLNKVKNVEIVLDLVDNNGYSFDIKVYNMTEDLFINYYDDKTFEEKGIIYDALEDGVYTIHIDNITDIIKYTFEFFSLNDNCYAESVHKKYIIKPMYNSFSNYSACSLEYNKNSNYCKKFLTKDLKLTEPKFFEWVSKQKEKYEVVIKEEEKKTLDIFKEYWYIGVIIVVIIGGIVTFVIINKRRYRL